MDFIGLLRQMHNLLYTVSTVFIVSTIIFIYLRKYKDYPVGDEEQWTVGLIARRIYKGIIIVLVLAIFFQTLSILSSNRIPRNSEDRSDIYKQAEENGNN